MTDASDPALVIVRDALQLGLAHHQAGRLNDAVARYQQVLDLVADQPDALHYLGVALHQGNMPEAAVQHLERAVAGKPDSAEAYNHFGCALLSNARSRDAEAAFQRACALNPAHAEAHFNLGTVLHIDERGAEAVNALTQAVNLAPGQMGWRVKLAEALKDIGDLARATRLIETVLQSNRESIDGFFQRSRIRELQGRGASAARDLMRCAILVPQGVPALNNLARNHMANMDPASAARVMDYAAKIAPCDPVIRYNLADSLLASGDLEAGWREYRWRHLKEEVHVERHGLPPEWDGGAVRGGGLLIYHEQGIGDELRFASCLADTAKAARAPCTVECDPRLLPLFVRSFPELRFVGKLPRLSGPPTTMDYTDLVRTETLVAQTALGELPRHTRPTIQAFDEQTAYISPAASARQAWRAKLDALGPGLKIGFLWNTGLANKTYAHYFFGILDLRPVFTLANVHMVNLQYNECEEDLQRAEAEFGIEIYRPEGIDLRNDLDDLAALIGELDIVIGPMTSVLSMAGAVGTRCIGMNLGLDWTSLGSDHQPWTPSMTVVYKGSNRQWPSAVEDVAAMIAKMT